MWLAKAANQGHVDAQNILGNWYAHGFWHRGNEDTAIEWYLKAAEQGLADAQRNLGLMLFGVKNDPDSGLKWIIKAAENGHAGCSERLREYLFRRGRFAKELT